MAYISPSIVASGTTFAQFQAGGASGHLERLIGTNLAGTSAPTAAPTGSASGTGATLPSGTYRAKFTETNGIGETTPSPESSGIAVTLGQALTITFPALQVGNTARNLYLTGGASGTEVLYATGITTTTFTCTQPIPTNSLSMVTPPTANTTGLAPISAAGIVNNTKLQLLRSCKAGQLQKTWNFVRGIVTDFNRGEPVDYRLVVEKLRDAHAVFAMLATLCAEMGALVDANPGTLVSTTEVIGSRKRKRTWP